MLSSYMLKYLESARKDLEQFGPIDLRMATEIMCAAMLENGDIEGAERHRRTMQKVIELLPAQE